MMRISHKRFASKSASPQAPLPGTGRGRKCSVLATVLALSCLLALPGCAGDPATTAATTLGPMAIEALAKIPQLAHDQAALAQASAAAHTSGTTIIKATHATIIVKDGKATVIPRHTTPSS